MTISTKTVGIILRKRVLKDADISLAIFTQAHGKISVMAKGVRHLTSRRAGHLQTGSYVTCIIRQSSSGKYLQQSTLISALYEIKKDPLKLEAFMRSLFLLDRLLPEELVEIELYTLYQIFIKHLSGSDSMVATEQLTRFTSQLLQHLGHHDQPVTTWSECREICERVIEEKLP